MNKKETLRVLIVRPLQEPVIEEVPNNLKGLQAAVGGLLEYLPLAPYIGLYCDEEHKLKLSMPNRVIRDPDGMIYDVIGGDFIIVRSDAYGNELDLTDDDAITWRDFFCLETTSAQLIQRNDA